MRVNAPRATLGGPTWQAGRQTRRGDSREVNKCREVEDTSVASRNKDMMRKKSVRKEARCERNARIEDWARKSQANPTWLRLRLRGA